MLSATLLGASNPPAGGAATSDVIYATAGAMVVTVLLMGPILLYKQGRFPLIGKLAATAEKVTGLPGWAALPGTFLAVTLLIAVFGMYWDISLHIDHSPTRPTTSSSPGSSACCSPACSDSPSRTSPPGPRSRSRPAGSRRSAR
jgi:hypothetical protein